ncbi:hypothetical protein OG824_12515 [Streptomyces prunicolor]|nr:hypothetical protein [Streptomyces prunicolor]
MNAPGHNPPQPPTARTAHQDAIGVHLPDGAVERGVGEVHPDDVVDVQVILNLPSRRMRTVIAEVADRIASPNSHRLARTDRFNAAPRARIGSARAC